MTAKNEHNQIFVTKESIKIIKEDSTNTIYFNEIDYDESFNSTKVFNFNEMIISSNSIDYSIIISDAKINEFENIINKLINSKNNPTEKLSDTIRTFVTIALLLLIIWLPIYIMMPKSSSENDCFNTTYFINRAIDDLRVTKSSSRINCSSQHYAGDYNHITINCTYKPCS